MSAPSSISRRRTFWPAGPGLVGDELHAEDLFRLVLHLVERPRDLDAAALAAAAGVDLRLHDPDRAAELLRRLDRLVDAEARNAARRRRRRTCGRFPCPGTRGSSCGRVSTWSAQISQHRGSLLESLTDALRPSRSTRAPPARAPSSSTTTARSRRVGAAGVPADLPAAGLGRARPDGDLGDRSSASRARRSRRPGVDGRATSPPSASPTSARPPWSGTARPASRSTTPSSGRTGAPRDCCDAAARRGGHERAVQRARPAWCSTPTSPAPSSRWMLDHVPGARAARRARRAGLRHRRHLAGLEADRRQRCTSPTSATPRARCCSTSTPATGTTSCSSCCDVPRAMLPEVRAVQRASTARPRAGLFGAPIPIAGIAGDQQAALFGQACFTPGHGQEHLRHRLLHADEHRQRSRCLAATGCSPPSPGSSAARTEYALEGSVFIAGAVVQWLRDGLGMIRIVGRRRSARRERARQRRRLSRAGLRRPGRAALGPVRARRDRRPHARHHARATSRAPRSRASPSRAPTCSTAMQKPTPGDRR